jgi:hypothetical protein
MIVVSPTEALAGPANIADSGIANTARANSRLRVITGTSTLL